VCIAAVPTSAGLPPDADPQHWEPYVPSAPAPSFYRELSNTRLQYMLPSLYALGDTTRQLSGAVAPELDQIWLAVDQIPLQTYVEEASWGIDQLELEVGLIPASNIPLEERRQLVRAILTPADPVTLEAIQAYLARFPYGTVQLNYVMGKTLTVTFVDVRGTPLGIDQMIAGLNAMIPAWIGINYVYRYTTHAEIKAWGGTLAAIKATGMTHRQIQIWTPGGAIPPPP
jgi:hypothetical protein